MNVQLLKPIQEATYLTVPNAWRYRSILRYVYQQHERLRHYIVLEEIYQYLKQEPHFREFTEEQLQQDLDQLVSWKNLIPRQDTGRVSSIEEFKKRKFRYQLTPYTIEIERMVLGLEHLGEGFGGSLERTLFDRLLGNLMDLTAAWVETDTSFSKTNEEIYLLWQDLYENFHRLTDNAADYLAHLHSEKVEEQMMTEAFLVYKEALTEYLRNFMTSLQRTSFRIEGLLDEVPLTFSQKLTECVAEYELSIPRLDVRPTKEQLIERFRNEWDSLRTWFLGDGGRESDLIYLQNATNDTIRRLTRFAQRLGETHHNLRNRRLDYLHMAKWYSTLDTIREAHELSACVFGVFHTRLKAQVKELSKTLTLPLDEPSYEKASEGMATYREVLNTIESLYQQLHSTRREQSAILSHLEDISEAVDELRGEINELEDKAKTFQDLLKRVEQRLQDLGADEIRERIQNVIKRLNALPDELETCLKQIITLTRNLGDYARKILEHERDLALASQLQQGWANVFQAEETLQTSFIHGLEDELKPNSQPNFSTLGNTPLPERHLAVLIQTAEELISLQDLKDTKSPDRETLRERINEAFTKEMGNLVEYRLTQNTLFEALAGLNLPSEDSPELWLKLWEELRQKARRVQLMLEYDGKRVNPYYLRAQLEKNMALQRQLLNEKDRELYEEIIMNSVGRIIRGRIQRAEHWVEEMNRLMDERDTSSGLRFRIRWKPRTAEHEDEIDTQDLVELLKSDPRLLKESDMSRITNHFRVKIERAKQQLEVKGYGESFHQIIKEMLDYRQWFEFRLFFQKEGENWRELTDRAFYQFSGGEKAMAMYIPLFSAAYSRYSDARSDAPRIISLDEAFAGVDENNIRNMFDLLEKLGFNYIMNSQALWGDYDTVAHLAIAELVRPKNASYVTVIRYSWDGKVRRLIG